MVGHGYDHRWKVQGGLAGGLQADIPWGSWSLGPAFLWFCTAVTVGVAEQDGSGKLLVQPAVEAGEVRGSYGRRQHHGKHRQRGFR